MKNIISYLNLNQVVIRSRYPRFDSLSLVSRQSVLAIIVVFLTAFSGNAWGATTTMPTSGSYESGTQKYELSNSAVTGGYIYIANRTSVTVTAASGWRPYNTGIGMQVSGPVQLTYNIKSNTTDARTITGQSYAATDVLWSVWKNTTASTQTLENYVIAVNAKAAGDRTDEEAAIAANSKLKTITGNKDANKKMLILETGFDESLATAHGRSISHACPTTKGGTNSFKDTLTAAGKYVIYLTSSGSAVGISSIDVNPFYTVTHSLTNVTKSSGSTGSLAALSGSAYNATFAASDGYTLPDEITVTIGGSAATAGTDYTWNSSTGEFQVPVAKVTGAIVVTITGETAAPTYRTFKSGEKIYFKDVTCSSTLSGAVWDAEGGNVYAYFWNDTENAWSTYGDKVEGEWHKAGAIYRITVPGSGKTFTKVLFTRGTAASWEGRWDGAQTNDQTPDVGKNLFIISDSKSGGNWDGTWSKYVEGAALIGSFNDWDPDQGKFVDGRVILELDASTNYEFKVLTGDGTDNNNYWACDLCSAISNTTSSWALLYNNQSNNFSLTSGEAGEYCFHWNNSTHYLGVYYPQARFAAQQYIYFNVEGETGWKSLGNKVMFWTKYYDSGDNNPAEGLSCTSPLETYVYYTQIPNNDYIGRVQLNMYDGSTLKASSMVSYAYSRTSSKQNCMIEEEGKESSTSEDWTPQWTTYCPPMSKPTLSDGSPAVCGGSGTSEDPWLVEKGSSITFTVSGSTSSVPDGNMTAKYQFKDGETSKQDGTETSYTLTVSSTENIVHNMSVEAYNYYNSTSSTHTASDHSYYKAKTLYTITYKPGDYSSGDDIVEKKAKDVAKTLRGVGDYTRTGYNQTAWNTNKTGGGTSYSLNGSYTGNTNLTLYPTWTAKTTTLTLNPNTANHGTGSNVSVTATYAAVLPSFDAAVPASGYGLVGYYTDPTGGTKIINADGTLVRSTTYSTDAATSKWNSEVASLTLYAQYQLVYTVTYNANGDGEGSATGTTGSVPVDASSPYAEGDDVTVLDQNTLAKSGNAFAGWNTEADGSDTWRVPTETFTMGSANVTLYAQWVEEDEMVPGTLYMAVDMAAKAAGTLTTSEIARPGISANGIFEILGTGTGTGTGGAMSARTYEKKTTVDGVDFMSVLFFKGVGSGSPSGTGTDLPTSRAIKFRVGEAGTLHLYVKGAGAISLIKSGGTAAYIGTGTDDTHVTVEVTSGTYYLFATESSRSLYGMKLITCTDVDAPTNLTCSAQTPNTLTYTWEKASNASGYTATLYPDEDCEETPVSTQVLSDVATVTFTSLTASTTYYCKVQSNGDGSTYCENGGTTDAQSGTTTAPRIIYNANLEGTSGSTTDGTSTEGAKACGYSKSGYKFKWWNTATNGSGEDFYVGESVTLGGSDVNLYAQWEEVGSDEEFWVGDPKVWHATTHDVTVGDMNIKPQDYESKHNMINADFTGDNKKYTIVNATEKRAVVMAVGEDDRYVEISFTDGSTINELNVGVAAVDGTNPTMAVLYSTTSDFSSGEHYFAEVEVPTIAQTSKQVTSADPDESDKYKYVRIYMQLNTSVYSETGGSGNKIRIYSIKAQKGTASYTVTYADGGADDGDVPVDDNEYAEGAKVTVLGNTGSLTKTEHAFGGWSDGVTTYAAGDKFDMPASDVTLTAVWTINQYKVAVANVDSVTITATPAGGSAISEGNDANVDYGKSVTLAYSSLESGNYWGGWKVTKNSNDSDVTAGVVDGNTLTVPAYAVTVSAVTYGDVRAWCDPDITITGDIHLTSVNGVSVYATDTTSNLIRIKSNDLAGVNKLGIKYLDADDNVITGSDRLFRLCDDGTPNYNIVDSKDTAVSTTCDLYFSISYTPNAYDQLDYCKLQIEMKRTGGRPNKVVTHDLYGRSLPEEFVIATKGNDGIWYALPNTIVDNSSAVAPIRITVDNETTPTAASYAPNTTVYKGDGRYNNTANRYGVRFTDGVLKDSKLNHLQISSSTSTHYPWLSYSGSSTNQDWWLKSTDFSAYELNVPTSGATSAYKLGIYGGNIGYFSSVTSGSIFLLPITNKYTDIPASVTEWGQHSVILAANPGATATKAQARVEGGSPTADQTISAINAAMGTAKNVKVPVGDIDLADLANNEGKLLYIDWYNSSSTLLGTSCVTIPRIIAANRNMKTDGEPLKNAWTDKEVHVLPGVTLTANTNDYATNPGTATIKELHIYPGATLNVSTGTLTATTLRLHNGWTRAGEKQYNVARVYIADDAALTHTTASMDYDIYEQTDGKHYYPLAVPFETSVGSIDYADSYLAGFSTYGTHYGIKAYNGARRAEQGPDQANNWSLVASDATLAPGKGYIMTAVAVKGEAIIRIPLVYNDAWTADGEKGTASYGEPAAEHTKNVVAVTAHTGTAATANKSNAGWNMLGVPFMSCYSTNEEAMTDGSTTEFINGKLILTGDPSSPLAFDDKDEHIYVNVPTHDFSEYLQTEIDEATLLPGWCFMVQIGKSGNLTFLTSAQAESSSTPIYAPRRERAEMPVEKTGIILSGGEASDRTTILVSDKYSAADYEINADLEKLFGNGYTLATYSLSGSTRLAYNAMSTSDATAVIPIGYRAPAEGEYTFSINPRYAESGAFSRVDLIDYETSTVTNLLYGPYTFESDRTQNDARFALNVVMAPQTPTDIESISDEGLEMSGAHKMIIDEKLYIILDGKMYDATGKVVKGGQK